VKTPALAMAYASWSPRNRGRQLKRHWRRSVEMLSGTIKAKRQHRLGGNTVPCRRGQYADDSGKLPHAARLRRLLRPGAAPMLRNS